MCHVLYTLTGTTEEEKQYICWLEDQRTAKVLAGQMEDDLDVDVFVERMDKLDALRKRIPYVREACKEYAS